MRSGWLLLAGSVLACGPDAQPINCPAGPDFKVLISAEYGPLPSDTVIRLHYGGRAFDDPEELVLADPATPQALFCYVSDRNGMYPQDEVALGNDRPDAAGAGGAGGESSGPGAPIQALLCALWTDGAANLDVVTQMYGVVSVKLQTTKNLCTVESTIELMPGDGGM
jgi:hypothetical protein